MEDDIGTFCVSSEGAHGDTGQAPPLPPPFPPPAATLLLHNLLSAAQTPVC